MNKSRREFIKLSAIGAGGLVLANPLLNAMIGQVNAAEPMDASKIKRFPTYCEVCFWKCAGWVYTDEKGEIWKIEGNEDDPHSNGRFCPRGTGGLGMYNDPDRLKTPLMRVEENGKQTFKEVSWDKAFRFIAEKMNKIKEESGPESLALFKHGSGGAHFGKLFKAFGSKNITAPSYAQCRGPREVGFNTTFGSNINSPEPVDLENTKCLVLIGNHIGENMHNSHVQEMSKAIDRGATIITVDPRLSTAASKSKYWLPIKPATDIALLLAWMNVIVTEELYDKKYIEQYAYGLEDLLAHITDKTPEWAEKITSISADVIRQTAREMAFHAPATLIHPGRHVTWYGDDTQRLRAMAMLNALLGSWGRKGGFYFPEKAKVASYPHPGYPPVNWTWKDHLDGTYALAGSSIANVFVDMSHPDNKSDYKIKGWFVVGTNLISTIPDTKRTLEAIQNLDLLVVVDTMPMEITGYADIILPECTYLERYDDMRVSPNRFPNVAVRVPAVKPKYLSKPSDWIVRKLAKKLKLSKHFNYESYGEVIDWQLKQMGSSLAEMKEKGVLKMERKTPMFIEADDYHEFGTSTGMIELYSLDLEMEGFDPIPNYTPHPEPPTGYYRLNYGRAPMHTFGRTANNPNLNELMSENSLWVNPFVAADNNLENGQEVWLKNQDGVVSDFPIKVRVTERIGKDNVYMVHGFGRANKKLKRSFGKGISDSQLITNVMVDPVMGGTGMRGNFVSFVTDKPESEVVS
ncbi:molybdopterin-containing oxidoreductase family protein [Marinifilum flexuosum]|uniref:molybdopterin-containing oxidoreductase family protein n=1 Tax=Marinifilum flexuosum TaxID=1117708 RepID=UPI0024954ECF|nr:molybdopterin-dependent oxidoreductase [Marinifilum flexuosum]